jgi:hypothetical protein
MAKLCGWDGKPSVTYYGDDNRTVVVCDEARRRELIEQRQRLLETESTGTVIKINGDQADSQATGRKTEAAVTALPAPEKQAEANAATGNGIVPQNQRPTAKQDPLCQWRDSVGRSESWGGQPVNQGQFGPYTEELEIW